MNEYKKLSFSEYLSTKATLLKESNSTLVFTTYHCLTKYCKVPFTLNEAKLQLSFKPRDAIIVKWNRINEELIPIEVTKVNNTYIPKWNNKKMKSWIETNSIQVEKKSIES